MKRGGAIIAKVVEDTSRETIKPFVEESIVKDASVLVTDECRGYNTIDKSIPDVVINHNEKDRQDQCLKSLCLMLFNSIF